MTVNNCNIYNLHTLLALSASFVKKYGVTLERNPISVTSLPCMNDLWVHEDPRCRHVVVITTHTKENPISMSFVTMLVSDTLQFVFQYTDKLQYKLVQKHKTQSIIIDIAASNAQSIMCHRTESQESNHNFH